METKGANGETEAPLLVISYGEWLEKHLVYSVPEKQFRRLNIPVLTNKLVLGSSYGWLILVELVPGDGDCCLFNPISMDQIQLPKLNESALYNQCILSKPPTEPDCYILFHTAEQSFCRIGDKEYTTRTLQEQTGLLRAIGCFQGKTYGFVHPGEFVTIHFVGKSIDFRPIPMVDENDEPWVIPHSSRSYIYNIWLIESAQSSGGELLMVQEILASLDQKNERLDFNVFRVDTKRMKCTQLDSIGERTIFLSHKGRGYCCPSTLELKANSIYYMNIQDRNLNIFDLEDRSIISTVPSYRVAANKLWTSWVDAQIFRNVIPRRSV